MMEAKSSTSKVLLVGGFPSGGTDLLKTVLNAHPKIYINGEMPFLFSLPKYGYSHNSIIQTGEDFDKFKGLLKKLDEWHNLENINSDVDLEGGKAIREVLRPIFSDKEVKIWGNKTPQNSENIINLLKIFPDAYFLIITRDIRDICLSWKRKWGKNLYLCAARWAARMKKAVADAKNAEVGHVKFIKYEDLLGNPDKITKEICQFVGIDWSDLMLEHHKHVDNIVDGKIRYGEEIKPDNIRKWERVLSKQMVKRIEEISFDTMKLLGYEPEYAYVQKNLKAAGRLRGYLHDLWAMVFIGNRQSRNNSLKDRLKSVVFEIKKRLYLS